MIKYRIVLTESEREGLKSLLSKGRHTARKLTRARVLLLSDEGRTEEEIVTALGVGAAPVERLRTGRCRSGLGGSVPPWCETKAR